MLATAGGLPAGPGWSYEFKWDGVRVLASSSGHLWARSGAEVTRAYPELAAMAASLPPDTLLDGEVVALVDGRPSFTRLAERMHVRDEAKAARLVVATPITYMAFDLLRVAGEPLLDRPYAERRAALERLDVNGPCWMTPPAFTDGPATSAAARENGLEGVMAKRLDTPYLAGLRTPDWIKVKFDRTGDYVIGGWRPGARRLGGLLVGVPDEAGLLHFRGRVGGGIGGDAERELLAVLGPLAYPRSPFSGTGVPREDARGAHWVRPELVVEVKYGNRTPDKRLRFPRFLRLRPDKTPGECLEED
ncbi:ATP-dependent DNA ligase [Spirilliplanes yamanashiensis]|uniref:DNA ligase (ATP) n=2 Tax=Spirilliplanes yamanashiensis TaxID=42233 RepID=A0A8J3Y8C6_9ACTN|nr:ATP-dependent DNA ligase [Spirilliplanes yamanashiensis]